MEEVSPSLHVVDLKMNSMSKDIEQIDKLCFKLTESIEKLQEVNISLTKMITLHEEKIEQRQRIEDQIRSELRDIHIKITRETKDFYDKLDQIEKQCLTKIEDAPCVNLHKTAINTAPDWNKFHWMILGAALALGWLFGNINLVELASLLK